MSNLEVKTPEKDMLLRILNQEGMFYALSISKWSARSSIKPQELNLPKKVNKQLMSLGSKKLMLKSMTRDVENAQSSSYDILKSSKYSQPFFGLRFVNSNMIHEVEAQLVQAKAYYFSVVDQFMADWGTNVSEMRKLWIEELATLYPNKPNLCAAVLSSIMGCYPDPLTVRKQYTFDWLGIACALPNTEIAASVSDLREVQETTKTIERMQGRLTDQLEGMVRRDAESLEEAIAKLCDEVLDTSEQSPSGLHQRTVNKIKKEIEALRAVNYADVGSVTLALNQLDTLTDETAAEVRARKGVEGFRETISNIKSGIEVALEENKDEVMRGFIQTGRRRIETPF